MKVAVILARGGSKRIKRKNIKIFNGKPIMGWVIEMVKKSELFDKIIVSTDDNEIASFAEKNRVEVPFKRPSNISEDVDTEYVLQHAVEFLEEKEKYEVDAVVLLQPTSPFRKSDTIRKSVELYKNNADADSVTTVNDIEGNRPEWMLSLDSNSKVNPYATPFLSDNKPVIKWLILKMIGKHIFCYFR